MTTRPGSTPSSTKICSCASPTSLWSEWVLMAIPLRSTMHALLDRADPPLVGADLADDARAHAGPVDPIVELGNQLVRQLVDAPFVDPRNGRVVRTEIPAAAHHDGHLGPRAQGAQPLGPATDARQRQVDHGATAASPEVAQLVADDLFVVGQPE